MSNADDIMNAVFQAVDGKTSADVYEEEYGDEAPANPMQALLLTRSEIRDLPKPAPLIEGLINQGNTVVLSGDPGSGKSFLILDWLACLVTHKAWQGHATHLPEGAKVLYIAAEGQGTINDRLDAWESGYKHHTENGVIPDTFVMYPDGPNLMTEDSARQTADLVRREGAAVVVIDTMARVMHEGDENSARDVSTFVKNVETVRRGMDESGAKGTLIIVHHNNKSGVMRGSTALLGAIDAAYTTANESGLITIECEKRKDAVEPAPIQLRLRPLEPAAVLETYQDTGELFGNRLVDAMKQIVNILPLSRAELVRNVDIPELQVARLLNDGIDRGLIIKEGEKVIKFRLSKAA